MAKQTRTELVAENEALLDALEDARDTLDDVLAEYAEPEPEAEEAE